MLPNAVIYTRLSTIRDGDAQTLIDQETTCRRLAQDAGLEVVRVFEEGAGVSAYSGKARPALDELEAYVRSHRGVTVLVWECSRLTRRSRDLGDWLGLVDDVGLRIISTELDTATQQGLLMFTIMVTMAQAESDQKSSRTKEGKRRQRELGRFLGGAAPNGYRKTEVTGALELDPVAAEGLRLGVNLYLDDGLSLRAVAEALTEAGHTGGRGSTYTSSSVRNAFMSASIAGLTAKADGEYRPILGLEESGGVITPARWYELLARIDARGGKVEGTKRVRRPASTLLSAGILRCGHCLGPMTTDRDKRGLRYRCTNRVRHGKTACAAGVMINGDIVQQQAVLEALHRLDHAMADAADEDDYTELDRIADNFKALTDPADDLRRSDLEAAISERRLQLNHASDMWAAGTIDVEQFTKLSHDGKLQIEAWQADLAALPQGGGTSDIPVNAGVWLEQLGEGTIGVVDLPAAFVTACGSLETARDVVGSVFDTIAVGPKASGRKPSDRLTFTYR